MHLPDTIEHLPIGGLLPYARNSRTHSPEQIGKVADSIRRFGFTNPVLIRGNGIVAGHGRVMAARQLGLDTVPVIRLDHLTEDEARAYVIADNKLAELAGWDDDLLALELRDLQEHDFDLALTGFSDDELKELLFVEPEAQADADAVPPAPTIPVTKPGDVWVLGEHRIMCGDSTQSADVEKLLGGGAVDLICTDPPYCSGGFQESGKSSGSVGTSAAHKMVANDTLSTRGYIALLKSAFGLLGAPFLYAFTDWRMWVYLFDVAESSGFGARSMIVWDKGTPGMGRGWRAQHELVLWGCKETPPYSNKFPGAGNVLKSKRTGNIHHTTEKPVDVMVALLENAPFAKVVADPFNGSGTTMIACEQVGRIYRGMELDALYVDVAVKRWQDYTGRRAVHSVTGEPFPG